MEKTCPKCGKTFNAHHSKQKYCSRQCSNPTINLKICPKCRQSFKPKHKEQRYCSRQCYDESVSGWGIEPVKDVSTKKEPSFWDDWEKTMNRLPKDSLY